MSKYVLSCLMLVLFLLTGDALEARDFYVDAEKGNDNHLGTTIGNAWRTIRKVNSTFFSPGDRVSFRRDRVWQEKLVVSSSGSEIAPILFGAYGSGKNPLIKTSNTFFQWQLVTAEGSEKVWVGTMSGVRNFWGAVREHARVPSYLQYPAKGEKWSAPEKLGDIENRFFYSPLNSGRFYFRNDSGNPGPMEIGARNCGIYIRKMRHVVIDGIDVSGPGGRDDKGGRGRDHNLVIVDASDNVVIRNNTLAHGIGGASIQNGSKNCVFQNVKAFDHGTTGLYFWEAGQGNKAVNCEVRSCGGLLTDFGDMGLIGVYKTPGVVIEACLGSNNGHLGQKNIDAAISLVRSPFGRVDRCRLENAGGTAIQFAENSDFGVASYNIISKWGVFGSKHSTEGIRIGGGATGSTARACKIYNNLIMNGGETPGEWAALRILNRPNDGLEVKNNIFYNNSQVYDVYAQSSSGFGAWVFSNNLYFRNEGNSIKWNGRIYGFKHVIGKTKGAHSFDSHQEVGSMVANPKIKSDLSGLEWDSPCINKGTLVPGVLRDFLGNPVPNESGGVSIGPFEYGVSSK